VKPPGVSPRAFIGAQPSYRCPAQLAHYLRQPPCCGSRPAALRHFKKIKKGLRADALHAVVADLAARSLKGRRQGEWLFPEVPVPQTWVRLDQYKSGVAGAEMRVMTYNESPT
jgi:hypothetical protein